MSDVRSSPHRCPDDADRLSGERNWKGLIRGSSARLTESPVPVIKALTGKLLITNLCFFMIKVNDHATCSELC
jgi:hypothetical protein